MTVGIVGLGLIGGSFAKAYKAEGHTVLVYDKDEGIQQFAIMSGSADGVLDIKHIDCDLLLIALYPDAAIEYLYKAAEAIDKGTTVIDCCGTKQKICKAGFALADKYGFVFVGGHPMAGKAQSGFKHSSPTLFKGASMIIVPPIYDDINFLDRIKTLFQPAKFGRLTVTTAEKHDEIIAFTSQLPHLASNGFIKSPIVSAHKGFSAGSYKDLTRVAWLNEDMWTELFMENREHLLKQLELFILNLNEYKTALLTEDSVKLKKLLVEGKLLKEEDRK
ncbi:MAG: prephenate dehydrogenase/arogenate dehydrogenase family protein [Oscillospiraceae bacterium]|nr:prephenate dehydrogenase/arogenate dehydrogenase family protein [Oscillospiraceae bacterium]